MKIAIHFSKNSFSNKWVKYCEWNNIPFKIVNCYRSDIIQQLEDCDALMWHFHHANSKDVLFAEQLLYSVQASGKRVFPDFNTSWHFDDKVGQKYLLESIGAPLVPSWVFYNKDDAIKWAKSTSYPKVFKLRRGSGSANVRLVKTERQIIRLINKSFGRGFRLYNPWGGLKERWRKFKVRDLSFLDLVEGIGRIFIRTRFEIIQGRERGYVYFQDFIPFSTFDSRIIIINKKAFGINRKNRENDFRASGSHIYDYNMDRINKKAVEIAFFISEQLGFSCMSYDFIYDSDKPKILEMSYGFGTFNYVKFPGYWDLDLKWHEDKFNPFGLMVEDLIKEILD